MDAKQHAWLARALIDACGGVILAGKIPGLRVAKSMLGNYQDPFSPLSMPADIIDQLEAYCGRPIYSEALFTAHDSGAAAAELLEEACEASEAACALQRAVRLARKSGLLSEADRRALLADVEVLDRHVARARLAVVEGRS